MSGVSVGLAPYCVIGVRCGGALRVRRGCLPSQDNPDRKPRQTASPDDITAAICVDAVEFETREDSLASKDLKKWGAGGVVRMK